VRSFYNKINKINLQLENKVETAPAMRPPHIRVIALTLTLMIFIPYGKMALGHALLSSALLSILLIYGLLVVTRTSEWSWPPYALAAGFVVAASSFWAIYGDNGKGVEIFPLLWPLLWMLATMPRKRITSSIVLALLVIAAAVILNRNQPNLGNMLIGACGLYLGCRGITFVKEGYRLSMQHMAELDEAHSRLQQAHEELQEATVHSMRYAALSERARLARDIHDGIGHRLTSLIVQLQAMEMMLPDDPQAAAEQVKTMLQVAREAMREVRQSVKEWSEDESGVGLTALRGLASQAAAYSGIRVDFHADDEDLVPPKISVVLYRVLQEALTNAMRHSGAIDVQVKLGERDGNVVLTVSDNGCYPEEGVSPGFGMKGMAERCQSAGGTISFERNVPRGLTVRAEIPLHKEVSIL
jgi:signal transduction histidine kinase